MIWLRFMYIEFERLVFFLDLIFFLLFHSIWYVACHENADRPSIFIEHLIKCDNGKCRWHSLLLTKMRRRIRGRRRRKKKIDCNMHSCSLSFRTDISFKNSSIPFYDNELKMLENCTIYMYVLSYFVLHWFDYFALWCDAMVKRWFDWDSIELS